MADSLMHRFEPSSLSSRRSLSTDNLTSSPSVFNGTIDANGLNNPRAPWSIVNGAAGHYDGLDVFDKVKANGSAHGIDGQVSLAVSPEARH